MKPAVVAAMLFLASPAFADQVRQLDQARLADLDALLGSTLRGAFAAGAPGDIAVLVEALEGEAGAPEGLEGDWRCRWLKMGDLVPLVVYPDFACRIEDMQSGWRIEKVTGSQRFWGTLEEDEGGIVFTGVAYTSDGPATDYAGLPPDSQEPVEPGQTVAMVGLFEQTGPRRARLLLPDPILESRFDIIQLTRGAATR